MQMYNIYAYLMHFFNLPMLNIENEIPYQHSEDSNCILLKKRKNPPPPAPQSILYKNLFREEKL